MAPVARRRSRRSPLIVRFVRMHWRLFVAAVIGALAALVPIDARRAEHELIAWNVGIACYLTLAYLVIHRATVDHIRRRAAEEDEGRFVILVLTVAAAVASLRAIIAVLGAAASTADAILAMLTILLSWAMIHTIFAFHYAHEFYREDGDRGGGMTFPGNEEPDYWDFVYFSFVVGMTSQVSDVAVCCKPIRQTVTAHGIVSFIFNAALVALSVNIASNLVKP